MKKKCCVGCDDKGNCAFVDCKCHLNNIPCKECGRVYCKHYESDFDRFLLASEKSFRVFSEEELKIIKQHKDECLLAGCEGNEHKCV